MILARRLLFPLLGPGGQGGYDLYIVNADSYIHP
jgi:hypothetical protein